MATKQPTPRQLAYLDELKMRLQELRDRQATFMEQTAKMLSRMSSPNTETVSEEPVATIPPEGSGAPDPSLGAGSGVTKGSKGNLNIKELINRFEDLRKTSQEFGDLPEVPEELLNVDVRRILKGYEKLIEDGHVLQQSWFLLKKSTESCARFASTNGMASVECPALKISSGIVEVTYVVPERSPQVVRVSRSKESASLQSNVVTSSMIVDKKEEVFSPTDVKWKCRSPDYVDHSPLPSIPWLQYEEGSQNSASRSMACHLPEKKPIH
ncbi:hypothetical protein M5D96_005034 [Drosophila gunungcola]|uniref:Uncharacterized protein n=1 Tax=Drosophila gunungcola TaxID=103775 RepID=A0A9P9YV83_9MUSC|nr:hypothetical protein M5D96_005034 [Drosophila gunungcola]